MNLGEHKRKPVVEYKASVPQLRQFEVFFPKALWERMERAQVRFTVPATKEGELPKTPSMNECVVRWLENFLDLFEAAVKAQELQDRRVLTPSELELLRGQQAGQPKPEPIGLIKV